MICEFAKTTPTIISGSIIKIEKTNLTYIEQKNYHKRYNILNI